MPTFVFTSPDGKKYSVNGPEGATEQQAWQILQGQLGAAPQISEQEPQTGFMAGLRSGIENLKGDIGAVGAAAGVEGAEEYSKAQREKAAKMYKQPEFTEHPLDYLTGLAGQSLPYMVAPVVAGGIAATAPVSGALGLGAATAGTLAAGATSAAQFTGSNISRQLEEGVSAKDANVFNAVAASIPQAALDTVSMRMIPGLRGIFAKAGVDLAEQQAAKLARDGIIITAAKTGGIEGITEAGQAVLERAQAGLNITDEEARKEYFENFIGGALLGGAISVPGASLEKGRAINREMEQQQAAGVEEAAPLAEEQVQAVPMPTDKGMNYGTATQEVEILKKQDQTPETEARIAELQQYKADTMMDYFRNAKMEVSPELQELRKQMEAGDMTFEGQQRFLDSAMAEYYQKTKALAGKPAPKSEIDQELNDLNKEAKELSTEYFKYERGGLKGKSLRSLVANTLDPKDAFEVGPTNKKEFGYLVSRNRAKQTTIDEMMSDSQVFDPYLPPDLRAAVITPEKQSDAVEYIREKLRNKDFRPYDVNEKLRQLGNQLGELDARIQELSMPTKIQEEVSGLSPEERTDEAARLAAEEGYLGAPLQEEVVPQPAPEPTFDADEYYPDKGELGEPQTVTPPVVPTATQAAVTEEPQAQGVPEDTNAPLEPKRGLYMQAAVGERGMAKTDVDAVVNTLKPTWANAPDTQVVQSINELPEEIQADIARDQVNPRGVYDPTTKKVFLVADNISNDAQAAITLAHEAFGHFGLRVALGKNFSPMMSDIYAGNKNVRTRADVYIKDGMKKETAVEEVLSEMAQEIYDTSVPREQLIANRTALQKVMNAIRQFLAKLGVPIKTIDDATVLDLIRTARHAVVKGEAVTGELAGGKAKFSVKGRAEQAAARAKEAIHRAGQKRTMDKGILEGIDDDIAELAEKQFTPENQTIITKLDKMQDKFWQRLAQGLVDQYRTIKEYTEEGYMLARMSKTVDGALEGLLFHGQVFLNDGALDIKSGTDGLMDIMAPLGKYVDRYQMWVALNREAELVQDKYDVYDKNKKFLGRYTSKDAAQKAMPEGGQVKLKKGALPSVNPKLVKARAQFAEGKLESGRNKLEVFKEVQKEMNKLNRSVLDVAFKQGLIDRAAYDIFAADINYIPFYKAMEDGDLQGAATASGLGSQYFSQMLEGGEKPFGDLMENTLRNWSHILSASMKNKAAAVTLDAASQGMGAKPNLKVGLEWRTDPDGSNGKVYSTQSDKPVGDGKLRPEQTTSEGKGMIKVMVDGKPMYYKVTDELLLNSVASIGYMGPKSKFLDVARDFKNILQYGVTLSPGFKVRNLFRDSIQAMAVSGLKRDPFGNVVNSWADTDRNNPTHISALAGGGIFNFGSAYEGDQSRLVKKLIKMGVNPDTILTTEGKIKAGLQKAWMAYNELGNKSEAINRIALYKQLREQGKNHLQASFEARDLMDFSMQGAYPALRMVTQVVPFLNARLQGLYKLGRDGIIPTSRVLYNGATGKESTTDDKLKFKQFSTVTGAVMLASMMLYLAFKDDEEFKKREEWDRDNFWWFRIPGMDEAIRVPKPFEIGAFGTMTERVLEQIIDQGAEGKQFEESLKRMLSDTFAMNPTPQFIKPLIDLYANKDSFTGAPIETAGMERLSKAERAAESTSPLAKALSAAQRFVAPTSMEMSPVQVDYAIKSYFGWLGGTVAASSHYAVMPFSKGAYPDHDWAETMSMGFIKSLPATQSKYVTAFYENNKQISQAYADMRHYAELGDQEKVQELLTEKGDLIGLQKSYDRGAKDMAKIRQAIQAIQHDETMSGAQKKEEIDRLKVLIGVIAEQLETVRKSMKK